MKIRVLIAVGLLAGRLAQAEDQLPDEGTFKQIASAYDHLITVLGYDKTELRDLYAQRPARKDYFFSEHAFSNYDDTWSTIDGALRLSFLKSPFRLHSLHSKAIDDCVKAAGDKRQTVPEKSLDQAVSIAKGYLDRLGCTLPSDYHLGEVRFDASFLSCWEVRWWRVAAGIYSTDRFDPVGQESVSVVFHETLGLEGFGFRTYSPPPKSLEVKVARETAILKASRVAPLVERTPFYKQSRVGGFVIKALKEANLQVAFPNWLLDPARAVYIRDKPPTETRLCWVVRFLTVNGNAEPMPGLKLITPEILIYVDATTGEIVGANFM